MEGERPKPGVNYLHFCSWWKLVRLGWQKIIAPYRIRERVSLDFTLYRPGDLSLAILCFAD